VRLDRLLGIILHLLDSGQASAGELARRFGTSERTIYRDMDALSLAGVPLVALPGAGGGYQLAKRYSLEKGFLSAAELASLRAVLTPLARASGDEKLALALGKLAALGTRDETGLPAPISVSPFPWGWDPGPPEHFAVLRRAIDDHRLVRLDYSGFRSREKERLVEPYTLALGGQAWYLHAFCRLRSGFRLFRLSRIESAEALDEGFDPRARLPCPSPWSQAWGSESFIDVTIRVPASARLLALDRFPRQDLCALPEGGFEVRLRWPEGEDLVRYLLGFGNGLEVVSPPKLRDSVRAASESIAQRNSQEKAASEEH
jgi:predicted DNA-binding transcriptional regulator YafY